jgi:hypothetical protein
MESLHRRGLISNKAMGKMSRRFRTGTQGSGVPTKMAGFEDPEKDEAGVKKKAEVPSNEINHPTNQGRGLVPQGEISRGGRAGRGGQPTNRHIDQEQTPLFPKGGSKPSGSANRQIGVKGPAARDEAPSPYGGPSSRKYG